MRNEPAWLIGVYIVDMARVAPILLLHDPDHRTSPVSDILQLSKQRLEVSLAGNSFMGVANRNESVQELTLLFFPYCSPPFSPPPNRSPAPLQPSAALFLHKTEAVPG